MSITLFPDGRIIHSSGVEVSSQKMHDQWVIESDVGATNDTLTTWTRSSLSNAAAYLTGMSHSSGVFTFPKTGVYRVDFRFGYYRSDYRRYVGALMQLSTNSGGSFFDIGRNYTHLYDTDSNNTYNNSSVFCHIDVQNASTYRMRFRCIAQAEVTIYGATDDVRTVVQFERIAGT